MSVPVFSPAPRTRGGARLAMLICAIVFAGIAVLSFVQWSSTKASLEENGRPDFNTLSQKELKDGLQVSGTIDLAIECYAESYGTTYGIRTSDDSDTLFYLIPVYDPYPDGSINIRYFITYEASPGDFAAMDAAVSQMWTTSGAITPQLTLENAEIAPLPGDVAGYLDEYVNEDTFYDNGSLIDWCAEYYIFDTEDPQVIASKLAPYMIHGTSPVSTPLIVACVFAGIAALCFILFLILALVKKPIKGLPYGPPPDDFSKMREFSAEQSQTPPGYNGDGFDV